jgi:hypothetical protein
MEEVFREYIEWIFVRTNITFEKRIWLVQHLINRFQMKIFNLTRYQKLCVNIPSKINIGGGHSKPKQSNFQRSTNV